MIWKTAAARDVGQLIEWLLARKAANGKRWPGDTATTFALHELGQSFVHPKDQFMALRVLNEMSQAASDLLGECEAAYERVAEQMKGETDSFRRWTLVVPIDLRLDEQVAGNLQLTVHRRDFTIVRYAGLTSEQLLAIQPETLGARLQERIDVPVGGSFVCVEAHGRTFWEAWDQVAPAFDLLRGAIEFWYGRRQARLFTSRQQPRSQIPYPTLV